MAVEQPNNGPDDKICHKQGK